MSNLSGQMELRGHKGLTEGTLLAAHRFAQVSEYERLGGCWCHLWKYVSGFLLGKTCAWVQCLN